MNDIRSVHFVGVGGIGMSGLAELACSLGIRVSGSDRSSAAPENKRIFDALKNAGVEIFPQDGSVYSAYTPDILVYSTAVEQDNPDFVRAPSSVKHLHRSGAMELLVGMSGARRIFSVGGTCGKTTVTAMLAEALYKSGSDPSYLCGGLLNAFSQVSPPGNFRSGKGGDFVLEADESDKSLLNYHSDISFVLNIGTDHYSKSELEEVFRRFILGTEVFSVVELEAFVEMDPEKLKSSEIILFSADFNAVPEYAGRKVYKLDSYRVLNGRAYCSFDSQPEIALSSPGLHNAANTLAVYAALRTLGLDSAVSLDSVRGFSGVWRRFDFAGRTGSGAAVYDDYAHNAEKVVSAIRAAKDTMRGTNGCVMAIFQPHGFRPLEFMREELFSDLEQILEDGDTFSFLPVYYAGGTASFKPTSMEVAADYALRCGKHKFYRSFANRLEAEKFIEDHAKKSDTVLIMGARDNSLSEWAKKNCKKLDF